MSASASIGRIGALAVALGIGAAVTTGAGPAWAGPATAETSSETSSQQDDAAKDTTTAPDAEDKNDSKTPRLDKLKERIRKGLAVSSGGALTSNKLKDRTKKTGKDPVRATDDTEPVEDVQVASAAEDTGKSLTSGVSRSAHQTPTGVERRKVFSVPASPVRANTTAVPDAVEDAVDQAGQRSAAAAIPVRDTFVSPAITDVPKSLSRTTEIAVLTAAPAPESPAAPRLVSGLLAAVGLAPLATNTPQVPGSPPALLALVAWARREYERTFTPSGTALSVASISPAAALIADPNQLTPQLATPIPGATVTPDGPTQPGEQPEPNWVTGGSTTNAPSGTPGGYGINGTDLGIMWDDGDGNVLMLFGDTFDGPGMTGVWRNNVLLRSVDHDLSDGLQIQDAVISPGGNYNLNEWSDSFGATQVIRDPGFLGLFGSTTTIIPTAAVSVTDEDGNVTQYANVMSVRTWDTPGRWTTNWSAIAYSTDGGLSWTVDPDTVRSSGWLRSSTSYVPGNQNFQQGAFVQGPETDVNEDGVQYMYSYGTPSGRGGSAYVSRVPEDQIRDLGAYEYWAGEDRGWVANDPSAAVPVIGATDQEPPPSGFIGWITKAVNDFLGGIVVGGLTGGNVSEMSVQYNPYLEKYVVLYTDGGNNVVMRVSDSPQGTWSEPTTLVPNEGTDTGMYAPMIHPWSGTEQLGAENEQYLYWNLSYWDPYNVQLKQTDLKPVYDQYHPENAGTIAV